MNDDTLSPAVGRKADKRINPSILPPPDADYMDEFNHILQEQFGLKVTNLSGHRIGFASARPGPWWPITGYRETLRGTLTKYEVKIGHAFEIYLGSDGHVYMQGEYDWNLHIDPAGTYEERFGDDEIVCEVTPGENYYDNPWFPLKGTEKPSLLLDHELCLYGPYVKDQGDDDNHEIHPIDAIWWRESSSQVKVILLQDAAKGRFREKGMFTTDPRDAQFSGWKPWVEYPQLEDVRIPFVYNPQEGKFQHIEVIIDTAMDISTGQQTAWIDSDEGREHQLLQVGPFSQPDLVQVPVLVRVTEKSENRYLAVQFDDLTCDAGGVVRGYVQLVVALGDEKNRHEGVLVLTLTFKKGNNNPVAHQ